MKYTKFQGNLIKHMDFRHFGRADLYSEGAMQPLQQQSSISVLMKPITISLLTGMKYKIYGFFPKLRYFIMKMQLLLI